MFLTALDRGPVALSAVLRRAAGILPSVVVRLLLGPLPPVFTPRTSAEERSHRPARFVGSMSTFVGPPLAYTPVYRLYNTQVGKR